MYITDPFQWNYKKKANTISFIYIPNTNQNIMLTNKYNYANCEHEAR